MHLKKYAKCIMALSRIISFKLYQLAVVIIEKFSCHVVQANVSPNSRVYVSKAHDVMTNVIAKGSAMRQDAVNKAKTF